MSRRPIYTGPAEVGHFFDYNDYTYEIVKVTSTHVVCKSVGRTFVFVRGDA